MPEPAEVSQTPESGPALPVVGSGPSVLLIRSLVAHHTTGRSSSSDTGDVLWPVQMARPSTRTWVVGEEFVGHVRWQEVAAAALSIDLEQVDRTMFNAPGGSVFVDPVFLPPAGEPTTAGRWELRGRLVEEGEPTMIPPTSVVSRGQVEKIFAVAQLYDRAGDRYVIRAGSVRTREVPSTDAKHAFPDDPNPINPGPTPNSGVAMLSRRQYEQRFPERVTALQWKSDGFVMLIRTDGGSSEGGSTSSPPIGRLTLMLDEKTPPSAPTTKRMPAHPDPSGWCVDPSSTPTLVTPANLATDSHRGW